MHRIYTPRSLVKQKIFAHGFWILFFDCELSSAPSLHLLQGGAFDLWRCGILAAQPRRLFRRSRERLREQPGKQFRLVVGLIPRRMLHARKFGVAHVVAGLFQSGVTALRLGAWHGA